MAIRQYIGARYVPKFYDNPNGTSEWLPNVIYEPLTIVTYDSNSYTSKKTVPASVGIPANNPEYWVATGNMNAFIDEIQGEIANMKDGTVTGSLQNQIDELQGEVDSILPIGTDDITDGAVTPAKLSYSFEYQKLNGKSILLIGDSISDEGLAQFQPNWVTYFRTKVTNLGATFTNMSLSGRTLSNVRTNNLASLLPNITGTYDYILLQLGINDWEDQATYSQMTSAINDFKSWLDSNQIGAQVYIITPFNTQLNTAKIPCTYYRYIMKKQFSSRNLNIIDAYYNAPNFAMKDDVTRSVYSYNGDGIHPNATYAPIFANYVYKAFMFGDLVQNYGRRDFEETNISINNTPLRAYIDDDGMITLLCDPSNWTPTSELVDLGTLPEWCRPYVAITFMSYCSTVSGGGEFIEVFLKPSGKLYAIVKHPNELQVDFKINVTYDSVARTYVS